MRKLEELGRNSIYSIKPYVPGKPIEEVEREYGISGVIKLASNENPLGPSSAVLDAVRKAVTRIFNYPDSNCYYLKRELANFFNLSENNFIIGNGTDEVIKMLGETFLEEEDEVIYPWPSFSEYIFASKLMGAKPIPVHLTEDFKYDFKHFMDQISSKTKLIFICNPNNPTGTIAEKEEVRDFIEKVPSDILVVIDEAYDEYATDPSYSSAFDMIKSKNNVVVLRTFSKIYGLAGLRVGYGMSSPEIISLLNRVREPFNVNLLAQEAAAAALKDQEHVRHSKDLIIEGKHYLYKEFKRLGLDFVSSETNFIFVDIKVDSTEIFKDLLKEGVIIRTGDIFDHPTYIRVTVGTAEQNKRLISSLEKVLKKTE